MVDVYIHVPSAVAVEPLEQPLLRNLPGQSRNKHPLLISISPVKQLHFLPYAGVFKSQ